MSSKPWVMVGYVALTAWSLLACSGTPAMSQGATRDASADLAHETDTGVAMPACPPGAACDDGVFCTVDDLCSEDGETCEGMLNACDDGIACTSDSCDEVTKQCLHFSVGCQCDEDGDCDDANACTAGACDKAAGTCVFSPLQGGECDDGMACTVQDVCNAQGLCEGQARDCDDGNACTVDVCHPDTGDCDHDAAACDCTSAAACDDARECTEDICDSSSGTCVNTPNPSMLCDDGVLCTVDACGEDGDCVQEDAACECASDPDCNDGSICSLDACDGLTGTCNYEANVGVSCDDGDLCTFDDVCTSDALCFGETTGCDDGIPCTTDACIDGVGCVFDAAGCQCLVASDCDDSNGCTEDSCVLATDTCESVPLVGEVCNDDDACTTVDRCNEQGICTGTEPEVCDDGIACTADSCVPAFGCVFETEGCLCLVADDCKDNDPCTQDVCDLNGNVCVNTLALGAACDDNDACTTGDQCNSLGACEGAEAVTCDDGVACTVDSCSSADGCVFDTSDCGDGVSVTLTANADVWLEGAGSKASYAFLIVGKTGNFPRKRSVLSFDTSALPASATILSAQMRVYYYSSTKPSWVSEEPVDRPIRVHRLLVPWEESSATASSPWATEYVGLDEVDAEALPVAETTWAHGDFGWKTFDITSAVQAWADDASTNHGVVLWALNEDVSGFDQRFYSREHSADPTLRPELVVEYVP